MVALPVTSTFDPRTPYGKRQIAMRRHQAMKTERTSLLTHWADLSRHILPRSFRAFAGDRNRGGRHHYNAIYDNTATRSLRIFGAGMMAGATSPARPWFKLRTGDPELNDYWAARVWLDVVAERMQFAFAGSNTYRVVHKGYEELGLVGQMAAQLMPHPKRTIHLYPFAVGEFCLQQNYEGAVNTVYREFGKSTIEVVREFGIDAVSDVVRQNYNEKNFETEVRILQTIEPRDETEQVVGSPFAVHMPFASRYFELTAGEENKILRESGFEEFPVLVPRWSVDGGDTYASSCPGMEVLGDVRQLQQEQLRKGQAIDYKTKPPLQVPSSMKDRDNDSLPGGINYYDPGILLPFDQVTPNGGIRTAFEVNLDLKHLLEDILDVRQRIREGFFADLFLMLANAGPNTRMTATEVAERHEEKLLMLGPALERLHNELLQPLIERTFKIMFEAGMFPPPPPELQGVEITVEFVSILAQAQRAVGSNSVDRFVGAALEIWKAHPEVLDCINFDEWAKHYARMLGVDAKLLVDDKNIKALRQQRAAAQMRDAQLAAQKTQSETAKNLAAAQTTGRNALTDIADAAAQQAPAEEAPLEEELQPI